jgi:translation initiation factor 2 subunit 1
LALKNRKELPDTGEIVVGTIKEVHDFGAYMIIDEYNNLRAFLPWSEVASRAVKNINNVIKENQKLAVKVIRVYRNKGQVDVSLKRVSDNERKRKMMYWKRTLKAVNLILMAAKQLNKTEDDAYKEVIWKLEDYFGDSMTGLEAAASDSIDLLKKAKISDEWISVLTDLAKKYIEVKHVEISGVITLRSNNPDGIEKIKKTLISIKEEVKKFNGIDAKIYTIGAPKYRIDLIGPDYKTLENIMGKIGSKAEKLAKDLKLEYSLERLKG